jgi:hypothetical protein
LFDHESERTRQQALFSRWRQALPRAFRPLAGTPALLQTDDQEAGVPFSRLTLTAQLEVLRVPLEESWALCASLNPFLTIWRQRACQQQLQVTRWPRAADRWLSGASYARRFVTLAKAVPRQKQFPDATELQTLFLKKKLCAANLYPLLWTAEP